MAQFKRGGVELGDEPGDWRLTGLYAADTTQGQSDFRSDSCTHSRLHSLIPNPTEMTSRPTQVCITVSGIGQTPDFEKCLL